MKSGNRDFTQAAQLPTGGGASLQPTLTPVGDWRYFTPRRRSGEIVATCHHPQIVTYCHLVAGSTELKA